MRVGWPSDLVGDGMRSLGPYPPQTAQAQTVGSNNLYQFLYQFDFLVHHRFHKCHYQVDLFDSVRYIPVLDKAHLEHLGY